MNLIMRHEHEVFWAHSCTDVWVSGGGKMKRPGTKRSNSALELVPEGETISTKPQFSRMWWPQASLSWSCNARDQSRVWDMAAGTRQQQYPRA